MADKQDLDNAIAQETLDANNIAAEVAALPIGRPNVLSSTHTFKSEKKSSGIDAYEQISSTLSVQGSGWSLGNIGGWTVAKLIYDELNSGVRGINQLLSFEHYKYAVGDVAGIYGYMFTDGGVSAQSDEGATMLTLEENENEGYFHGTVLATKGLGDQTPEWAFTSGNNWTTDGAFMLNISKGTIFGNILGFSYPLVPDVGLFSFLNCLPVTAGCLPISTACGILQGSIGDLETTADTPISCTLIVKLIHIQGILKSFIIGECVDIASSNNPEQAVLQNVVDNGDGTQTLTMKLRNPHEQALIFQGGVAGHFISFDANLAFSGMRSSYYAFGSLTGSDLIYGLNVGGSLLNNTLPQLDNEAATNDGSASSGFHLYPGAEIVSNPVCGQAKGTLEQNKVAWAVSDIVENPHYPVYGGVTDWSIKYQITPTNSGHGSAVDIKEGKGTGFGGYNSYIRGSFNRNPPSFYKGNGGPLLAPLLHNIGGSFFQHFRIDKSHEPGGAIISVLNPNNPNKDDVLVVNLDWMLGANFRFVASKGYWMFDGPLNVADHLLVQGTEGVSGTFKSADGKTVTVQGGLIIGID